MASKQILHAIHLFFMLTCMQYAGCMNSNFEFMDHLYTNISTYRMVVDYDINKYANNVVNLLKECNTLPTKLQQMKDDLVTNTLSHDDEYLVHDLAMTYDFARDSCRVLGPSCDLLTLTHHADLARGLHALQGTQVSKFWINLEISKGKTVDTSGNKPEALEFMKTQYFQADLCPHPYGLYSVNGKATCLYTARNGKGSDSEGFSFLNATRYCNELSDGNLFQPATMADVEVFKPSMITRNFNHGFYFGDIFEPHERPLIPACKTASGREKSTARYYFRDRCARYSNSYNGKGGAWCSKRGNFGNRQLYNDTLFDTLVRQTTDRRGAAFYYDTTLGMPVLTHKDTDLPSICFCNRSTHSKEIEHKLKYAAIDKFDKLINEVLDRCDIAKESILSLPDPGDLNKEFSIQQRSASPDSERPKRGLGAFARMGSWGMKYPMMSTRHRYNFPRSYSWSGSSGKGYGIGPTRMGHSRMGQKSSSTNSLFPGPNYSSYSKTSFGSKLQSALPSWKSFGGFMGTSYLLSTIGMAIDSKVKENDFFSHMKAQDEKLNKQFNHSHARYGNQDPTSFYDNAAGTEQAVNEATNRLASETREFTEDYQLVHQRAKRSFAHEVQKNDHLSRLDEVLSLQINFSTLLLAADTLLSNFHNLIDINHAQSTAYAMMLEAITSGRYNNPVITKAVISMMGAFPDDVKFLGTGVEDILENSYLSPSFRNGSIFLDIDIPLVTVANTYNIYKPYALPYLTSNNRSVLPYFESDFIFVSKDGTRYGLITAADLLMCREGNFYVCPAISMYHASHPTCVFAHFLKNDDVAEQICRYHKLDTYANFQITPDHTFHFYAPYEMKGRIVFDAVESQNASFHSIPIVLNGIGSMLIPNSSTIYVGDTYIGSNPAFTKRRVEPIPQPAPRVTIPADTGENAFSFYPVIPDVEFESILDPIINSELGETFMTYWQYGIFAVAGVIGIVVVAFACAMLDKPIAALIDAFCKCGICCKGGKRKKKATFEQDTEDGQELKNLVRKSILKEQISSPIIGTPKMSISSRINSKYSSFEQIPTHDHDEANDIPPRSDRIFNNPSKMSSSTSLHKTNENNDIYTIKSTQSQFKPKLNHKAAQKHLNNGRVKFLTNTQTSSSTNSPNSLSDSFQGQSDTASGTQKSARKPKTSFQQCECAHGCANCTLDSDDSFVDS